MAVAKVFENAYLRQVTILPQPDPFVATRIWLAPSDFAPVNPSEGMAYYNTIDANVYVYSNASSWVKVSAA